MAKASVIGFGNVFGGDLDIDCYILDALSQERFGNSIGFFYLAEDARYTDVFLDRADFGVVVKAINMGGPARTVHCWSKETFQRNLPWFVCGSESIELLAKTLTRAEYFFEFSGDLLFFWVEPGITEALGISREMRKALGRAIMIKKRTFLKEVFYSKLT